MSDCRDYQKEPLRLKYKGIKHKKYKRIQKLETGEIIFKSLETRHFFSNEKRSKIKIKIRGETARKDYLKGGDT